MRSSGTRMSGLGEALVLSSVGREIHVQHESGAPASRVVGGFCCGACNAGRDRRRKRRLRVHGQARRADPCARRGDVWRCVFARHERCRAPYAEQVAVARAGLPSLRCVQREHGQECALSPSRSMIATVSDPQVGVCTFDAQSCADERAKAGDTSPCEPRENAACFNASVVLDEKRLTICSVSVKDCEARRAAKAADPDFTRVSAQCGVYRVQTDTRGTAPAGARQPQASSPARSNPTFASSRSWPSR
jgi:hypothetical protein